MNLDVQETPTSGTGQENSLDIYTCDICNQTFTSHLNLTIHKQSHEAENQYKCSYCNKMFSRRSYWRVHELGHSRPYRCDLCNQSFTRQYNLTVHLRVHTGEKPYRCDECGQSFTRQYTLVLHKRMHSGEKPHECPVCGRRFSRMQTMRSHVKTHGSGHACGTCNLAFPNQQKLERHVATHHKGGDKPYICNVCGFRCSFSSSLQRHKQKHKAESSQVQSREVVVPVVDRLAQNPEVMHPAQVTRLEQNIGFLRDQQEHVPGISGNNNERDISQLAQGGTSNLPHQEPSWMVLNDGRIINVESTSSGFPQISPETSAMGNQYLPPQDTPALPLGVPGSQATSLSSVSSDNSRSENFHPSRKNEEKRTSCRAQGKDIVITNVCSLTSTGDPQSSATRRSDSQISSDTDDNNESSENTQESCEDVSSLNCIQQMLQRQDGDEDEQSQTTSGREKSVEDSVRAAEKTSRPAITGSQKRKASLLHGYFRDSSKDWKELGERNRRRRSLVNSASEFKRRSSHGSSNLRKSSVDSFRAASNFDKGNAANRLAGSVVDNLNGASTSDARESERVQTTDVSTSTSRADSASARGFQRSGRSTAGETSGTETQPNATRSQGTVSTSSNLGVGCKTWRCHHCSITFEDNVMFIIHMGCHGNQNPFQCNSCGKECEGRVDFMLHFISGQHQG